MEQSELGERWRVKCAYDPVDAGDGYRVLVEESWPTGLPVDTARVDLHRPEVAPSAELMAWFREDAGRFIPFARSYLAELDQSEAAEGLAAAVGARPVVTLLVATRDAARSQGPILRAYLECLPRPRPGTRPRRVPGRAPTGSPGYDWRPRSSGTPS